MFNVKQVGVAPIFESVPRTCGPKPEILAGDRIVRFTSDRLPTGMRRGLVGPDF